MDFYLWILNSFLSITASFFVRLQRWLSWYEISAKFAYNRTCWYGSSFDERSKSSDTEDWEENYHPKVNIPSFWTSKEYGLKVLREAEAQKGFVLNGRMDTRERDHDAWSLYTPESCHGCDHGVVYIHVPIP